MGKQIIVSRMCPFCRKINSVWVDEESYRIWERREKNIQDIFPNLTPDQRECIMTGFHPECWNQLWGVDPDEKEYLDQEDKVDTSPEHLSDVDKGTGMIIGEEPDKMKGGEE